MKIANYFIDKFESTFSTLIKHPLNVIINICVNAFNSDYTNEDVILILTARHDGNGALALSKPKLTYSLLSRSKVRIVRKKVSNIEEIDQAIENLNSQGAKIKALWLNAHSDPYCIILGERDFSKSIESDHFLICNTKLKGLSKTNPEIFEKKESNIPILKNALDKLDKDAIIVLDSCESGLVREMKTQVSNKTLSQPAIAQTIAEHASNRLVYAAIKEIYPLSIKCKWIKKNEQKGYKLEVKFTQPKASMENGIKGTFKNAFYTFSYLTGLSKGVDITAKFRKFLHPH